MGRIFCIHLVPMQFTTITFHVKLWTKRTLQKTFASAIRPQLSLPSTRLRYHYSLAFYINHTYVYCTCIKVRLCFLPFSKALETPALETIYDSTLDKNYFTKSQIYRAELLALTGLIYAEKNQDWYLYKVNTLKNKTDVVGMYDVKSPSRDFKTSEKAPL